MSRPSPRERVEAHIQTCGFDVVSDIVHVHGGKYKTLNDVLECWSCTVANKLGKRLQLTGANTLTDCAKGLKIVDNTHDSDFYGDLVAWAKPVLKPYKGAARSWNHVPPE